MIKPGKLLSSLKQGDPQAVAVTAVLVFLLAVCWFSWTLLAPPAHEPLPMGGGSNRPAPPPAETPLSVVIRGQQAMAAPEGAVNPFHRAMPERPTPRPGPPRAPETGDNGKNGSAPGKPPTPTPVPKPPPPPEPRRVTYVYMGMLRRPDGESVALVAEPKSGTSRYLKIDDLLPPLTVVGITPSGLEARQGDLPPVFLPRGEAQTFELPPE